MLLVEKSRGIDGSSPICVSSGEFLRYSHKHPRFIGTSVFRSIEKVKLINSKLAYMMTGNFMSDKLQFIKDFAQGAQATTKLDTAFWSLYDLAQRSMNVYSGEGFRIGLAGFNAGIPSFKCITVVYGSEVVPEGATDNYYLSGERDPVVLSEGRIKASSIPLNPSSIEIKYELSHIVKECIDKYPEKLGEPVSTLVLYKTPGVTKVKKKRKK